MSLCGEADGAPHFAPAPLAVAARGAGLAFEALLAPNKRLLKIDWAALLSERAALFGHSRNGRRSCGGSARLLPTRTDWIALQLPRDDDWRLVPAWLGESMPSALADDDSSWDAIAQHLSRRDASEVVERGRLIGLAIATAPRTIPGDTPPFLVRHASEGAPISHRPRVLDLTSLWAGPLATSLLGDAGFDVLKVESPTRPDGARSGPEDFFDLMNHGKRAVALDLRDTQDRAHFERLLETADLVVESARPRALTQLGYAAAAWVKAKPGRIWTSITGYGREHEWIAFGDDAAASAGLCWPADRDESEGPVFCADAIADPITGLHAAATVLAHIQSGRGGLLEFALRDGVASTASIDAGPLTLPTEWDNGKGWVTEGDQQLPIAAPRARSRRGPAPLLAPPSEENPCIWQDAAC
jgi:hypothetical protein